MGGNFTIFESAVSSLNATAQAISVASNNISNVNTPGYSRQQAILQANESQKIGGVELGRGVSVVEVQRVIDNFAELRLREASGQKSEAEANSQSLQQVENIFNEIGGDGLASFMNDFFNSFHDLSSDPSSTTIRQNILNKAGIMIDRFHTLSTNLDNARDDIDQQVNDRVNKVNSIAQDLFNINLKIQQAGGSALALKDQRNLKLKELSELTDVTAIDNSDGNFQVYVAQGMLLVSNKDYAQMSVQPDSDNGGHYKVLFQVGEGQSVNITSRFNSGSIRGFLDSRDISVPNFKTRLNDLAYHLATEVNSIHSSGYNLASTTGVNFFNNLTSATDAAANIALSTSVDGLPSGISAAGTLGSVPGGNTTALSLAALKDSTISFSSSTTTFTGYYGDLMGRVGSEVSSAQNQASFSDNILRQSQVLREQVSGVSIEEEQVDLIRYQSAFQAASKLVSVANDMLDLLVNLGK